MNFFTRYQQETKDWTAAVVSTDVIQFVDFIYLPRQILVSYASVSFSWNIL